MIARFSPRHNTRHYPNKISTQAVRLGSLQQFNQVMADHSASFKADKNYTLVQVRIR